MSKLETVQIYWIKLGLVQRLSVHGGPGRGHLIAVESCVVSGQGVPGFENFLADNAGMGDVQVDLGMSLDLVLVILQSTALAPPLASSTLFYHLLECGIQV